MNEYAHRTALCWTGDIYDEARRTRCCAHPSWYAWREKRGPSNRRRESHEGRTRNYKGNGWRKKWRQKSLSESIKSEFDWSSHLTSQQILHCERAEEFASLSRSEISMLVHTHSKKTGVESSRYQVKSTNLNIARVKKDLDQDIMCCCAVFAFDDLRK